MNARLRHNRAIVPTSISRTIARGRVVRRQHQRLTGRTSPTISPRRIVQLSHRRAMNARLRHNRAIVPKPLVLHPVSPSRAGTNPLHGRKRLRQPSASSSARLLLQRRGRRHRLSISKRNRRRPRRKSRKKNGGSGISRSLQVSKGSGFKRSEYLHDGPHRKEATSGPSQIVPKRHHIQAWYEGKHGLGGTLVKERHQGKRHALPSAPIQGARHRYRDPHAPPSPASP